MEVVSDCSTHLCTEQILDKSTLSTSGIEETIHSQIETPEVITFSTCVLSDAVHYSKPNMVRSLPPKVMRDQNSSNVMPLIVDVNIDTPQVIATVEVHSALILYHLQEALKC